RHLTTSRFLSVGSRRGRSMSRRGRRRPSCRLPLSHFCNHRITCARSPLWLVACSAMGFYFRRCDYLAFVPLYVLGHQGQQLLRIQHSCRRRAAGDRHRPIRLCATPDVRRGVLAPCRHTTYARVVVVAWPHCALYARASVAASRRGKNPAQRSAGLYGIYAKSTLSPHSIRLVAPIALNFSNRTVSFAHKTSGTRADAVRSVPPRISSPWAS